ncbi:MAG: hypothetical protein AB7P20_02360 [Rhizobiaceae bacterium]
MKLLRHIPWTSKLVALLLAAALVGGCRDSGKDSEQFVLDGKLVVFNYRVATATFLVNLKPVKPVGQGEMVVVSFEDPAGGEPIVVREKIWPNTQKTTIHSPPLQCIVKDRPYKVAIRIENASGELLQQIDTTVTSSQDQSLLPDKPLVTGPFYDPNPEVAGHPGGDLPGEGAEACPRR